MNNMNMTTVGLEKGSMLKLATDMIVDCKSPLITDESNVTVDREDDKLVGVTYLTVTKGRRSYRIMIEKIGLVHTYNTTSECMNDLVNIASCSGGDESDEQSI